MKKILTYVVILFISFGCDRNEDELLDQAVIENSFCLVENSEKRHSNNAGRTESFLCEEYLITTVVHNLSDGNGNIAYTTAEIQGAMDMLNTEFSQHNIVFDYQIQILEDSFWYYNNDSRAWSTTFLKDTSFVNPMQYNIFMFPVFGELRPPGATDLPSGEGKAALAIGGLFQGQKAALSPILIHEAGHTFSLEHQSPAGTTYTCGNYMYTPQEFPNQINCLQSFDSQQIDQMQNHIENSQYYQFARDYCEENSCVFSQWDLTNRPGSTVTNGSTVNYKIKEMGSATNIKPNTSKIRVKVIGGNYPIGVKLNGGSTQGLNAGNGFTKDFTINHSACGINPIQNAHLSFYKIFGGMGSPTVQVQVEYLSVTSGHTRNRRLHDFILQ